MSPYKAHAAQITVQGMGGEKKEQYPFRLLETLAKINDYLEPLIH